MSSEDDFRSPLPALARAVGTVDVLDELLAAILLESRGGDPTDMQSLAERGDEALTPELARTASGLLREAGAAREAEGGGIEFERGRVVSVLDSVRKVVKARGALEDADEGLEAEVVCTLPAEDPAFDGETPVDFGFAQITTRLLGLCRRAEDELLVFAPYLESEGIDWLLPGLGGALRRGVSLDLVTHGLDGSGRKFGALEPLVERAEDHGADLRLFDYFEERDATGKPLFTLHSKLLIVDGTEAYVGSANFTRYGFRENFEVGVLVRGEGVEGLREMCDRVVEGSAERVY